MSVHKFIRDMKMARRVSKAGDVLGDVIATITNGQRCISVRERKERQEEGALVVESLFAFFGVPGSDHAFMARAGSYYGRKFNQKRNNCLQLLSPFHYGGLRCMVGVCETSMHGGAQCSG